jgi:acetyltransferase-like isoleucine patch superfamily enzyme
VSQLRNMTVTAGKLRAHMRARWVLRHATEVGPLVRLEGRARVVTAGDLRIGERVRMIGHVVPIELVAEGGAELSIGDRTFINYGVSIGATQRIVVGAECNFGPYVNVVDSAFHELDPDRRFDRPAPQEVHIGDRVWLGVRVIVLPGVTIGDGSVIGAGSVVTRDIPPRSLAAGSPATVIRSL